MCVNVAIFLLALSPCCWGLVNTEFTISDDNYKKLPPIYHIDPYKQCLENPENHYCSINIHLKPLDEKNPSEIWKIIEKTTQDPQYFNHKKLKHAVCVKNNEDNVETLSKSYTTKYQSKGLQANVTKISCKHNKRQATVQKMDIVTPVLAIIHICLIIRATFWDQSSLSQYIQPFSIRQNFKKLCNISARNKHIDSIRTYTTILIIAYHTFISYYTSALENTRYIEEFPKHGFKHGFNNLGAFLVQTFFVLSGWLLTYNSFKIFTKNPEINLLKFFCLAVLNRYLRLIPLVAISVFITSSIWMFRMFNGPISEVVVDASYWRCLENGWTNLLFINNHYKANEMCCIYTWYLAADFQLYIISLIVLIILWKLKDYRKLILAILIASGIIIQALVIYINDFDAIYMIWPTELSLNINFNNPEFLMLYISTYSSFATYMIGIAFGYAIFIYEQKPIKSKILNFLFLGGFVTLPFLTLYLSCFTYSGLLAALIGSILKPLYGFGVGIGLFGMQQKYFTTFNKLFEIKLMVFLGNMCYSVYLAHPMYVFSRLIVVVKPETISDSILIMSVISDLLVAFVGGFLVYLIIEMPYAELQSILIPNSRLKKKSKST